MEALGVLILAAALGLAGGVLGWRGMRETFAKPLFARTNVRGEQVPVAVGVLLPITLLAAAAVLVVLDAADVVTLARGSLLTTVLAAAGFGLLGLLDDLAGDGTARGFAGHLRSLARGELTTGAAKLFGGGALAVVVASTVSGDAPGRLLADAALIALSANLANLFDRAPGRVAKVGLVAAVPIGLVAGADGHLAGTVVVLGALVALLVPDLREELMLGDSGANVLGAVLGVAVVLTASPLTRTLVLVTVAAFNLLSELVSFSSLIERTPPLRSLDQLGRRRID